MDEEKIICEKCEERNSKSSKYCKRCGYELPQLEIEEPVECLVKPKKKIRKAQYIGVIVGVIIAAGVYFSIQKLLSSSYVADKALVGVSNALNKTLPMMVDSETRLDNTMIVNSKTIQYSYTLVNMDAATVDTTEMKKNMEINLINSVKTTPQLQYQRDHDMTLVYYYKDKNGNYFFSIYVTPDKYK